MIGARELLKVPFLFGSISLSSFLPSFLVFFFPRVCLILQLSLSLLFLHDFFFFFFFVFFRVHSSFFDSSSSSCFRWISYLSRSASRRRSMDHDLFLSYSSLRVDYFVFVSVSFLRTHDDEPRTKSLGSVGEISLTGA